MTHVREEKAFSANRIFCLFLYFFLFLLRLDQTFVVPFDAEDEEYNKGEDRQDNKPAPV